MRLQTSCWETCVPSAKLTTTWARRYEDCPFAEDYSYLNGNLDIEEYKEGIFVGYRYFDSFGKSHCFRLDSDCPIQSLK